MIKWANDIRIGASDVVHRYLAPLDISIYSSVIKSQTTPLTK